MADNLPDYEVKLLIRPDLSSDKKNYIRDIITSLENELGIAVHSDNVTYSKKPPYKKYEDIPAGFKFYNKLRKYRDYFSLFEYYNYLEGDINGRIIRSGH